MIFFLLDSVNVKIHHYVLLAFHKYFASTGMIFFMKIVKLLAKSLHYNHRDHPPLTFKSLRGDLYSSVIHHWNRQLKPY